ncbi:hypothetical protein [Pseudarthrobacter sp. N5]|uniref:hypothetical protein n=1 Tax=Pseudarthrobacter sp. N5 TaxID=3418416 RepID=UPI003CEC4078
MITAGMVTGCSQPASSAQSTATALPTATPAAAGAAGLVKALHPHCDVGDKVLNYLATGDNGGDPQLDVLLSKYVGVDLPQARAIADQQIQQCDANLSRQEAAQASAAAADLSRQKAAQASATAAALEAADAAKKKATQDSSCAAIGGRVDTTWGWCASTVKGNPSGEPGSDCSYAQVAFNPDGTLAKWSSSTTKDSYPGCFQL